MPEYMDVHDIRDEFVICRGIGHSWDDNPNGEVANELFRSSIGAMCLRCVRCGTERFDYINDEFRVWQRYYRYPPNYSTIPGRGNRPNLRSELYRRSLLIRKLRNGRRKSV